MNAKRYIEKMGPLDLDIVNLDFFGFYESVNWYKISELMEDYYKYRESLKNNKLC